MAVTEAQKRAVKKYRQKHIKSVTLQLNENTDADIIRHLDLAPNKQGYIKDLIRKDIESRILTDEPFTFL